MKLKNNKKYLVAVSGGVDSIVLLDILSKSNLDLSVVHVNHCIREEANDDENFVKELSKKYGYSFYSKKIDIPTLSDYKNIEMVAREKRYEYFYEILNQQEMDYIVLGHNQNEQAETIFLNLLRGVSVSALTGMSLIDEDTKIIRPLLKWDKQKIIDYAKKFNLEWVEDKTNEDVKYDRNWIRHVIFPEINKRRNIIKNLSQKSQYFIDIKDFLHEEGVKLFNEAYDGKNINLNVLKNKNHALIGEFLKILYKRLHNKDQGFKSNFVKEFIKFGITSQPMNKQYISFEDYVLVLNKNNLINIVNKKVIQEKNMKLLF